MKWNMPASLIPYFSQKMGNKAATQNHASDMTSQASDFTSQVSSTVVTVLL